MIEEQAKQPRAAGGPCEGGDGYAACNMVLGYECTQCGRREAADDSAKASLANRTAFDCTAWLALAARWLAERKIAEERAAEHWRANRTIDAAMEEGRAETLIRCAEEIGRVAEAND